MLLIILWPVSLVVCGYIAYSFGKKNTIKTANKMLNVLETDVMSCQSEPDKVLDKETLDFFLRTIGTLRDWLKQIA